MSNLSLIKLSKSKDNYNDNTPLPETLTFYHTTPLENLESILKYGLTLCKYPINEILTEIENTKTPKWRKENARSRVLEAYSNNHDNICLSGNKHYSMVNGLACFEWKGFLTGKDWHNHKIVIFKIEIPIRILELLTNKNWRSVFERFKELWIQGYFKRIEWYLRVKGWSRGVTQGYDLWLVNHVPPEYIKSYQITNYKGVNEIEKTI